MREFERFDFTGVTNFRDFGGAASSFGGRVRTGRLYRSAHLADASRADIDLLQRLEISVVVDLRRRTEREHQPSAWEPAHAQLIRSDVGDQAEGPHVAFLRQGDLSDDGVESYLGDYYRRAPFEPRHISLFGRTLRAIEGGQGALLVHCTAGKDRTGLLAALIQRALGVGTNDVMDDFLETNRLMLDGARRARVFAFLEQILGHEPSEAILGGFTGVSASHLDIAFAAIETRCGGLASYLAELGLDAPALQRMHARLLV